MFALNGEVQSVVTFPILIWVYHHPAPCTLAHSFVVSSLSRSYVEKHVPLKPMLNPVISDDNILTCR